METTTLPVTDKLWNILKQTLLEKNADGTINVSGSMKRLGGLLTILTVVAIVLTCLQPSFSLHVGTWLNFNFDHQQYKIADYEPTIGTLLIAFGTYVGIGEAAAVAKKFAPPVPPIPPTDTTK